MTSALHLRSQDSASTKISDRLGAPSANPAVPFSHSGTQQCGKPDGRDGKRQSAKLPWISQVKDWFAIAEPSARAMKEQKRNTYKKYGIDPDDPQAAIKMHLPIGKVPLGATTSTTGPRPEKALEMRAREKQQKQLRLQQQQDPYGRHGSQDGQSMSSGRSSTTSVKGYNNVAPWDTF